MNEITKRQLHKIADILVTICIEECMSGGRQSLPFKRAMQAREILQVMGIANIHEPAKKEPTIDLN